jgi:ribosome recycling factor
MISELESRMEKTVSNTRSQLSSIRTGRANPDLLSKILVDYYGSKVPINQVGTISVPESRQLLINVFDAGAVQHVERAISSSDLGLNPQTEGSVIRLNLPELTEERRKDLAKVVRKEAEEGKVALRNIRREFIDKVKAQEKDKEISEDDSKKLNEEIQKVTDKFTLVIDELTKEKEADLLSV